MNKTLSLAIMAAGAFTLGSCSNDDLIESQATSDNNVIEFTAGVNRASRHTGDVTTDNLNSFYVTAFLRDPEYDPKSPATSPDAKNYFIWSKADQIPGDISPKPGTGTCLFFNQEFVRQGTSNTFKINRRDPYHWPGSGQYVTFFAFSPSLDILNANSYWGDIRDDEDYTGAYVCCYREKDQRLSFEYVSFSKDISKQVDFIVADPVTDHRAPGEYGRLSRDTNFNFKHLLSQVEIKVKTTEGSMVDNSYDVYVAGVKLSSCTLEGNYSLTDSEWTDITVDGAQVYYYFTDKDEIVHVGYEPESVMGNGGNAMTIPQEVTAWDMSSDNNNSGMYVGLLIRVVHKDGRCVFPYAEKYCYDYDTAKYDDRYNKFAYHVGPDGNKYQWAAIPFSCKWDASKKYVYTINLAEGVGYNDPGDEATGTGGELILNGEVTITESVEEWKVGGSSDVDFEIIEPEDDED